MYRGFVYGSAALPLPETLENHAVSYVAEAPNEMVGAWVDSVPATKNCCVWHALPDGQSMIIGWKDDLGSIEYAQFADEKDPRKIVSKEKFTELEAKAAKWDKISVTGDFMDQLAKATKWDAIAPDLLKVLKKVMEFKLEDK